MFDRLYRWAMSNGSRLLFALALILPGLVLLQALSLIGRFGPLNDLRSDWFGIATHLLSALSLAVMPLLGALLVDRIDRRLGLRERDPPLA